MKGVKVGQKVQVVNRNYGVDSKPTEHTVSKVGRKYFYLERIDRKYRILDGVEEIDYGYRSEAYSSLQEIEDKREHLKLASKLSREFRYANGSEYDLDTLRKVCELLNISIENNDK